MSVKSRLSFLALTASLISIFSVAQNCALANTTAESGSNFRSLLVLPAVGAYQSSVCVGSADSTTPVPAAFSVTSSATSAIASGEGLRLDLLDLGTTLSFGFAIDSSNKTVYNWTATSLANRGMDSFSISQTVGSPAQSGVHAIVSAGGSQTTWLCSSTDGIQLNSFDPVLLLQSALQFSATQMQCTVAGATTSHQTVSIDGTVFKWGSTSRDLAQGRSGAVAQMAKNLLSLTLIFSSGDNVRLDFSAPGLLLGIRLTNPNGAFDSCVP